ncbi:Crp/Fnr family transcriptional regulator [Pontibacter silvestris]|uniref:Crp/Fnr family transcriptional regulator n=1 Tax=Pontibacter silvestris TaxID=2305183 RepID=A0ABW4X113_9BACT|nr:hypothetical protein [Pontibacter silvestris]MCC9137542.1 hypothetical protein [Pontibacter silvestris]
MLVDKLFEAMLRLGPIPDRLRDAELQDNIRSYLREATAVSYYSQKQLLLSAGQPADYVNYIEQGFARGFYLEERTQRQVSVFFWEAGHFAVATSSFLLRLPSDIYIEVMPGSRLLSLSHGQLAHMVELFPVTEALARMLLLRYKSFHKKRTRDLLTRSAWERYLDLLQSHPRIEQQVSKEAIASYLGITPQSLSRLLRENGHP